MSLTEADAVGVDYERRKTEAEKMQKRVGIMKKLKWVIKDKDKFGMLVEQLTGLNNVLYSLINPLDANILAKAVAGDLLRTLDIDRIRDLGRAARTMGNAGDVARLATLRQRAIEILRFPERVLDMELLAKSKGLAIVDARPTSRRTVGSYTSKTTDGGDEDATSTSTGSVLVEWKTIESNLAGQDKNLLDTTTNSLAFFFNQNNRLEGLRSLTCIGVTKPAAHSAESIRYGLVYELPGKPSTDTLLSSLFDMLQDEKSEIDSMREARYKKP